MREPSEIPVARVSRVLRNGIAEESRSICDPAAKECLKTLAKELHCYALLLDRRGYALEGPDPSIYRFELGSRCNKFLLIALQSSVVVIGFRDDHCDLRLDITKFARRHCEFVSSHSNVLAKCLGSLLRVSQLGSQLGIFLFEGRQIPTGQA